MTDPKQYFGTRSEIAAHFKVSRMTIYRWEKLVPLTYHKGIHAHQGLEELMSWRGKVRRKERENVMKQYR